jgi:hypothetical protein
VIEIDIGLIPPTKADPYKVPDGEGAPTLVGTYKVPHTSHQAGCLGWPSYILPFLFYIFPLFCVKKNCNFQNL